MSVTKEKLKFHYGVFSVRNGKFPKSAQNRMQYPTDTPELSDEKGQLFLIADSKIPNTKGDNPGKLAIESIVKNYLAYPSADAAFSLKRAFDIANRSLYQYAASNDLLRKIGATCTAIVLNDRNAIIGHVGDAVVYRVNLRKVEQLVKSHTRDKAVKNTKTGKLITKSVLTRALGVKIGISADIIQVPFQSDEYFVMASNSLKVVSQEEIQAIVLSSSPNRAAQKLIEIARSRGATSDITVQVIKIYRQFDQNKQELPTQFGRFTTQWSNWPVYFMLIMLVTTMTFLVHEPLLQKATAFVKWDENQQRITAPSIRLLFSKNNS